MDRVSTITRYLLGVMFTVFGANGFLQFIKQPPPSTTFAMQFLTAVSGSHYMVLIFLLQLLAGLALLTGVFVPLALVVLGAILVNILDFHITMDPSGIAPGLVATVLWVLTVLKYQRTFRPIFATRAGSA